MAEPSKCAFETVRVKRWPSNLAVAVMALLGLICLGLAPTAVLLVTDPNWVGALVGAALGVVALAEAFWLYGGLDLTLTIDAAGIVIGYRRKPRRIPWADIGEIFANWSEDSSVWPDGGPPSRTGCGVFARPAAGRRIPRHRVRKLYGIDGGGIYLFDPTVWRCGPEQVIAALRDHAGPRWREWPLALR